MAESREDGAWRGAGWDDLRLYLQVCRTGSFRAAAKLSGQAHNTIARRMTLLQEHYGQVFMRRGIAGVELTEEGRMLALEAERIQMQLEAFGKLLAASGAASAVKVHAEETLSFFSLEPRLRADGGAPAINFCSEAGVRPDLVVDWRMPADPDMKVRRIGRMHFVAAAAVSYLDMRPDMAGAGHVIVETGGPHGSEALPHLAALLGIESATPVLSSPSCAAALGALEHGAGIGWLPGFAVDRSPLLRRVSGCSAVRDIYLSVHPDSAQAARVRRAIDWLVAQFDAHHGGSGDRPVACAVRQKSRA